MASLKSSYDSAMASSDRAVTNFLDSLTLSHNDSVLKDYLMAEQEQWDNQKQAQSEQKQQQSSQKLAESVEHKTNKRLIKQWEKIIFKSYPLSITSMYIDGWNNENSAKKDPELQKNKTLDSKLTEINTQTNKNVNDFIDKTHQSDINEYLGLLKKEYPTSDQTFATVKKTVITIGHNDFVAKKEKALAQAKKLALKRIKILQQKPIDLAKLIDTAKIQQKIAQIPLELEEKLTKILNTFDKLLGVERAKINKWSADSELQKLIEKFMAMLEPFIQSCSAIEKVGCDIPIIGELVMLVQMLMNSTGGGGGQLSKEEINKLLLNMMPKFPDGLMKVIWGLVEDVMAVVNSIPIMLINIIFQILKIITDFLKTLGLGMVPPISYIADIIDAIPTILKFMWNGPKMLEQVLRQAIQDKLAMMMAMSIQLPDLSLPPMPELTIEDKPASKTAPEKKKLTYSEVVTNKLEQVNSTADLSSIWSSNFEYDDLVKIMNSYKKIYDGSKQSIKKFNSVKQKDDGTFEVSEDSLNRIQGTPEGFQSYLDKIFSSPLADEDGKTSLKNGVAFDKFSKTETIVGGFNYSYYKDGIDKKSGGSEIVVQDVVKP